MIDTSTTFNKFQIYKSINSQDSIHSAYVQLNTGLPKNMESWNNLEF